MAFSLNIVLLFSALFLLFISSKAAAQQEMATSPSENDESVEVIKDVEKNKEVQDLGRFAVHEVNKNVSYSKSLAFYAVETAKRWHGLHGWNYFLVIKSQKKVDKIGGLLLVYVYSYPYGKGVKDWLFKPNYA